MNGAAQQRKFRTPAKTFVKRTRFLILRLFVSHTHSHSSQLKNNLAKFYERKTKDFEPFAFCRLIFRYLKRARKKKNSSILCSDSPWWCSAADCSISHVNEKLIIIIINNLADYVGPS